jgi:hypothetical protein
MGGENLSKNASISLKISTIKVIDKYRVGCGYKNRSDYIQTLVDKDLRYSRLDYLTELMSMLVIPMMGFFFFLVLAVLTKGLLFYFFMAIFGCFGVWLSYAYTKKHKKR